MTEELRILRPLPFADDAQAIAVDRLRLEASCQTRVQLNQEAVDAYAEAYAAGDHDLPPIEVFDVDGDLIVLDGFHGLAAAIKAGHAFIRCTVVGRGSIEEATGVALSKNHDHGVRRTRKDKRRAVMMALELGWGEDSSNRALAKHLGVSHQLVGKLRAQWDPDHRAVDEAPAVEEEQKPRLRFPDVIRDTNRQITELREEVAELRGILAELLDGFRPALALARQSAADTSPEAIAN